MECKQCEENILLYLSNELDIATKQEVENHLAHCESCKKLKEDYYTLLNSMETHLDKVPHWSMEQQFIEVVEKEKQRLKGKQVFLTSFNRLLPYAAAAVTLLIGMYIGKQNSSTSTTTTELVQMQNEIKSMKEVIMVSMLKDNSASDRLHAISYHDEIENPSNEVVNILIQTLNGDESPNVRKAAIQALEKYLENEYVRISLVNAFNYQHDPMVQIELINALISIKEKRAIGKFNELIENENTHEIVKEQARIGTSLLI